MRKKGKLSVVLSLWGWLFAAAFAGGCLAGTVQTVAAAETKTTPDPVTDLEVEEDDSAVWLSWDSEENSVSFLIYRKKESGSYQKIASTEDYFYLDKGVDLGKKYTYRVIPISADGVKGKAASVQWIPRPQAVTNLTTTCQSKTKVKLAWDGSKYAKKYRIYRKTGTGAYEKLAETEKTSYVDKTVTWDKKYTYKILACNKNDLKGEAARIAYHPTTVVTITGKKYTYAKMEKQLQALAKLYSGYCSLDSIGKSVQKREIYDFSIGDPDAPSSLLVVSTLHAREYIASAVVMQQIEYYLSNYNKKIDGRTPQEIFSQIQVHYVVMANPDGVTISQTSNARWKANANGVDLNRNFPASKFVVGGKKGAQGYSGKSALNQPESKAVASLTEALKKNRNLVGVISYHAMGQIIYGGSETKSLKADVDKMYKIAKNLTHYTAGPNYHTKTPSTGGQYREYVMYQLGIPAISIEVGSTACPCAYREYETEFRKNKKVVLQIADAMKK